MLAADRGPGRRLLTLVYEWAARGYAAYVRSLRNAVLQSQEANP